MKNSLPILTMLVLAVGAVLAFVLQASWSAPAVAVPPGSAAAITTPQATTSVAVATVPPAATVPNPSTLATLRTVAARLAEYDSISARIRYRAELVEHTMFGSGLYAQQGRGADRMFRLQLKMQVGEAMRTWEQVLDGRFFWQYQDLADPPSLSRIDFYRVRRAIDRASEHAPSHSIGLPPLLSQGGLPLLMTSLGDTFDFGPMREGRLEQLPVYVCEGHWNANHLATLLPRQAAAIQQGQGADLKKLPSHYPDTVLLYLGRDDGFPYRVEYVRQVSFGKSVLAPEPKSLVAIEWFEVKVNLPLDKSQFNYLPGGAQPTDTTDDFLKAIGVAGDLPTTAALPAPAKK